jgi:hypothetical protein
MQSQQKVAACTIGKVRRPVNTRTVTSPIQRGCCAGMQKEQLQP